MKIRRLVVKLDTEWDFLEWGNKIINTGNKRKEGKVRPAFMKKKIAGYCAIRTLDYYEILHFNIKSTN